jgi:predicted alpha/beta-hydrolase family hydrolase
MQLTRVRDFHVQHLGPLDGRPVLVVVGRQNQMRRSEPIDLIAARLHGPDLTVCWHERPGVLHARLRDQALVAAERAWLDDLTARQPVAGWVARKALRLRLKLRYPKRHGWVFRRHALDTLPTPAELADFARHLPARRVFLLGHSAGGRIATLAQAGRAVHGLVCLGYPFRHPEMPEEPYRTAHLASLTKPCLILQGERDDYGNAADAARYALSPAIVVESVDTDHDWAPLEEAQIGKVARRIRRFLGVG